MTANYNTNKNGNATKFDVSIRYLGHISMIVLSSQLWTFCFFNLFTCNYPCLFMASETEFWQIVGLHFQLHTHRLRLNAPICFKHSAKLHLNEDHSDPTEEFITSDIDKNKTKWPLPMMLARTASCRI